MAQDNIQKFIQDRKDLIDAFQYQKALSFRKFLTLSKKKSRKDREDIASFFNTEGESMVEHGYYTPARFHISHRLTGKNFLDLSLTEKFQKILGLVGIKSFLNEKEAENLISSYYFSLPFEREDFKACVLSGYPRHITNKTLDKMAVSDRNPYKKMSASGLAEALLSFDTQLFLGRYNPLNLLKRFSYLSHDEKQEITHFCEDAALKTEEYKSLDVGLDHLRKNLLPYCFDDTRSFVDAKDMRKMYQLFIKARRSHGEKAKRMEDLIDVFGFMLLTKDKMHRLMLYKQLFPIKNKKKTLSYGVLPSLKPHSR